MHTNIAKKTGNVLCKPLKCTSFGIPGEYAKHQTKNIPDP